MLESRYCWSSTGLAGDAYGVCASNIRSFVRSRCTAYYYDKYKQYNAGHVPDLIKPGDSAWGTDWLGESKVPSPLRASAPPAG